MSDHEDKMLEDCFAAARQAAPEPDSALLARVMADARQVQSRSQRAPRRVGLWARLRLELGGWPAVAGLSAAALTGLWIGISPPDGVLTAAEGYLGAGTGSDYVVDLSASAGFDFEEGML
ncbi:hypothetical protein [Roseovarius pelagicus]|uniref:Dihydroorotate dehydrogenase n=1 Tax=Roseovarius pelagicus TaxID=2980108 RepID=A0ABY6DAA4_9RHOB|nr:hypothetical protein [Roseovarius pelagicus]UXX82809.1 hypothetical protein N7U68_17245 [Roseovarius pelagicus]